MKLTMFTTAVMCLSAATQLCSAKPVADSYAQGYDYTFNPAAFGGFQATPAAAIATQFHAQDESGQYNYGYSNQHSSKQETKSADGVVRGSYSYIDANGNIKSVDYISDVLGFRSVASASAAAANPIGYTQAAVKAVPAISVAYAPKAAAIAPIVQYSHLPYATDFGYYFNPNGFQQQQQQQQDVVPIAAAPVVVAPIAEAPIAEAPVVAASPAVVKASPIVAAEAPVVAAAAPVVASAAPVLPYVTQSQYHAQDEFGQYKFGYSDPNSARSEERSADGAVRGAYNYVDDKGKIQTVEYVADSLGFRAVGTTVQAQVVNEAIPVGETEEVAAARAEHQRVFAEVRARDDELENLQQQTEDKVVVPVEVPALPLPKPLAQPLVAAAAAPLQYAASYGYHPSLSAIGTSSQFHAQDESGQYNYGYSNPLSAKQETKTSDGVVQGSYSYVDANGLVQKVSYISDALGFRAAGTNIPQVPTGESVIAPSVRFAHLPYAFNHPYYY